MPIRKLTLFVAASCTLLLTACVVAPPGRPVYREPILVAPPAPRVEYVGPPPVVGQIWIGGFWSWGGNRHEWVPGHWEAPRPGYVWVPHRWERNGDRWQQYGGHWEAHEHGRHDDYRERRDERWERR